MQRNVGGVDKALRIIIGLILIVLAITKILGPWAWIGVVPLITGLMGTCPVYRIFKFNSYKR